MKYNKKEKSAIETLNELTQAINNKKHVAFTAGEVKRLDKEFGIDIWGMTTPMSNVKTKFRGKEESLITIYYQHPEFGAMKTYRYFNFQIKEYK
ncbi:hypothetical protein tloyanaT_21060 [Thalassotalea loyana]|uniref:Uncharacterized protein n=1 Tax=Thalassotalea loyana TaxID=280483 RepID=A0ABQ6HE89_9GAMM|nr:hypothetical protein [Thalassotalea loyana]GLX85854.1 hypothetical protein tloyanaT_21060 [Thalassotalea loyana]